VTSAVFTHHIQCITCKRYLEVDRYTVNCCNSWYKSGGPHLTVFTLVPSGTMTWTWNPEVRW